MRFAFYVDRFPLSLFYELPNCSFVFEPPSCNSQLCKRWIYLLLLSADTLLELFPTVSLQYPCCRLLLAGRSNIEKSKPVFPYQLLHLWAVFRVYSIFLKNPSTPFMIWNLAGTGLPIAPLQFRVHIYFCQMKLVLFSRLLHFLPFAPVSFLLIIKSLSRTMRLLVYLVTTHRLRESQDPLFDISDSESNPMIESDSCSSCRDISKLLYIVPG